MKYTAKDHTFSICAYNDSPYLRECIESVVNQNLKTNVVICTSTPSEFIEKLAREYGLILYVNEPMTRKSNIATDWNYAISCVETPLVTIAHQDDLYKPDYSKRVIENINMTKHPLIAFTGYSELRDGVEVTDNKLLSIKRKMLIPLRFHNLWKSKFIRRRILSFESAICCPSGTFVPENLPDELFIPGYRSNIDWQAQERLTKCDGEFVFVNEILMTHRIHEDSETSSVLNDYIRSNEDYEMFCGFWPKTIAGLIERYYKKGEESNDLSP